MSPVPEIGILPSPAVWIPWLSDKIVSHPGVLMHLSYDGWCQNPHRTEGGPEKPMA